MHFSTVWKNDARVLYMENEKELYDKLIALRDSIKEKEKKHTGRTPLVCPDESVQSMVENRPATVEDFYAIEGLGKAFITKYAESFLVIIEKYNDQGTAAKMTSQIKKTLKELEKNLVTLNKRNHLLYTGILREKAGFDLFADGSTEALDMLFGKKQKLVFKNSHSDPESTLSYKRITKILRETNSDLKDKGMNTLYIGYPYVKGKMSKGDLNIRAPLAFFPVTIEKKASAITIKQDDSRDILFNNTLVLASYKFNNIKRPLPNPVVEDTKDFFTVICDFYKENEIKITVPNHAKPAPFESYKADEFPKYKGGEFYLDLNMVLGRFVICDSSIQKDFDRLLEAGKSTIQLNNLLTSFGEEEPAPPKKKSVAAVSAPALLDEGSLRYINALNESQEKVLLALNSQDQLVVQGPPGTGKSQTITSIISDFVLQDKTVLLVSEKKTALDVVYSRLGELSKFALLIDDVGNKTDFYRQINNMITAALDTNRKNKDVQKKADEINQEFTRLQAVEKTFFTASLQGEAPYKLYQKSEKLDLQDEDTAALIVKLKDEKQSLLKQSIEKLDQSYELFSDDDVRREVYTWHELATRFTWISNLKDSLSDIDLAKIRSIIEENNQLAQELEQLNKIKKFFARLQLCAKVQKECKPFVKKSRRQMWLEIMDAPEQITESLEYYQQFQQALAVYAKLTAENRDYFDGLLFVQSMLPEQESPEEAQEVPEVQDEYTQLEQQNDLEAAAELDQLEDQKELEILTELYAPRQADPHGKFNDLLYNALLNIHLVEYETANSEPLQTMKAFAPTVAKIDKSIESKKENTVNNCYLKLSEYMQNLVESKRKGEILRGLETGKKMSVTRFLNKYKPELFKSVKIWMLTPEVVSEIIPLQQGIFDLVIFDEASQLFVEKSVPSIYRAKKVVIAGDSKQLRPMKLFIGRFGDETDDAITDGTEETNEALEEPSLLDLAKYKYDDVLLNYHYRSRYEELIAFSNYAFYQGRLMVSPNAVNPEASPVEVHKIDDGVWEKTANRQEAVYCVNLLKEILATRKHNETIGIITFNAHQHDVIEDVIDSECDKDSDFEEMILAERNRVENGEDISLFVKNIENVQGDERDIIIFSIGFAKNSEGRIYRNFGWLNNENGENRLNVAISRAKEKVHIVTSITPDELVVEDLKHQGPAYLKKYLEYAFAVSSKDSETARKILLALANKEETPVEEEPGNDFIESVAEELEDLGMEVVRNVGIGGYKLDLAVKKNNDYLLGIECDQSMYAGDASIRERDYHRQKFLESKGWKIYRLWSPRWWNDRDEVVKEIRKLAR